MKYLIRSLSLLIFTAVAFMVAAANNITVTGGSLTGQNVSAGANDAANYAMVQFTVSWENSWRTSLAPTNSDAAWVFVKYRVTGGDGQWHHATINLTGYTAPSGSTITPATDGTGAFIYRSADGTGTFTATSAQLRWNYGVNGVDDNATVDIKVFAIEMVYVPTGSFAVGGRDDFMFTPTTISTGTATTVPSGSGALGGAAGGYPTGQTAPGNASWPNGYNAFYCMKYEISQQQYVDFLNALTQTQATARKYDKPAPNYRYEISGSSVGGYSTTNPYDACNWLSWADVAAYLDWSGLRPMTELEFEKSCRGTVAPVSNEYAWGSTSLTRNTGITDSGLMSETSSNSGNATYGGNSSGLVQGPMRVGAFSTSSSTRVSSGAAYYGIMEMSGNLWERPVTMGNSNGRDFTGTHGNGALDETGNADASLWPGANATGTGLRGGDWYDDGVYLQVSDRGYAESGWDFRWYSIGGRGVRSVPVDNPASTLSIMISVAGGTFTAGSTVTTISSFSIDKYEVTYDKWTAVRTWGLANGYTDLGAGTNGYNPAGSNNPVTTVNWYDVAKWCNARSEKEGLTPVYYTTITQDVVYRTGDINLINTFVKWTANGYRLPTEAEWEYAAKGGASSIGYTYSGSNILNNVGWWNDNSETMTHTVGTKTANELGLYDMSGNVWERCWDWYISTYPTGGPTNPQGPTETQAGRVLRGGSLTNSSENCSSANRIDPDDDPGSRSVTVGFRCVQD